MKKFLSFILVALAIFMFVGCDYYLDFNLDEIKVTSQPVNNQFAGEEFDRTGMVVTGYYCNGKFQCEIKDYSVSPRSFTTTGTDVPVEIKYNDKTCTVYVDVIENTLEAVTVANDPDKLLYRVGETLDLSGLELEARYLSGKTKKITSGYSVNPTTATELTTSDTSIEICYKGKTANQKIFVIDDSVSVELKGIEVSVMPVGTQCVGKNFDATGMIISGVYQIGDKTIKSIVSGYSTTPVSFVTAGTNTVTVTYTEGLVTTSTSFNINVEQKIVESIEVVTSTTEFVFNDFDKEPFIFEGMEIKVNYSDGSYTTKTDGFAVYSPTISAGTVVTKECEGIHTGTVYYTEGDITKTVSCNLNVTVHMPVTVPLDFTTDTVFNYLTADSGIEWNKNEKILTLDHATVEITTGTELTFCVKLPEDSKIIVKGKNNILGNYKDGNVYDNGYAIKTTHNMYGICALGSLTVEGLGQNCSELVVVAGNNVSENKNTNYHGQSYGISAGLDLTDYSECNLNISEITLSSTGGATTGNRSAGIYSYGSITIENSSVEVYSLGSDMSTDAFSGYTYGVGYGIYRNKKLTVTSSDLTANRASDTGYVGEYFNGIYGLTSRLSNTDTTEYGATEISHSTVITYSWAATSHSDYPATVTGTDNKPKRNNSNDFAFSGSNSLTLTENSTLECRTVNGKSMLLTAGATNYENGIVPLNIQDSSKIVADGLVLVSVTGSKLSDLFTIEGGTCPSNSSRVNYQYHLGAETTAGYYLKCACVDTGYTEMTISEK